MALVAEAVTVVDCGEEGEDAAGLLSLLFDRTMAAAAPPPSRIRPSITARMSRSLLLLPGGATEMC